MKYYTCTVQTGENEEIKIVLQSPTCVMSDAPSPFLERLARLLKTITNTSLSEEELMVFIGAQAEGESEGSQTALWTLFHTLSAGKITKVSEPLYVVTREAHVVVVTLRKTGIGKGTAKFNLQTALSP